jgi:hypothetical protein
VVAGITVRWDRADRGGLRELDLVKAPPTARAGATVGTPGAAEQSVPTGFGRETGAALERSWGPVPEQKEPELGLGPPVWDGSGRHSVAV